MPSSYALARLLAAYLDLLEITFLRSALVRVAAAGLSLRLPTLAAGWTHAAAPPRAWDQRLAGLALIASTTTSVYGHALLPVTEAPALSFSGPIILTACGALLVRETVSPQRWMAVGLGFASMLVMLRPGGSLFHLASLVPIAAALS